MLALSGECPATGLWIVCAINFFLNLVLFLALSRNFQYTNRMLEAMINKELNVQELEKIKTDLESRRLLVFIVLAFMILISVALGYENNTSIVEVLPTSLASNAQVFSSDPWLDALFSSNFYNIAENNSSVWLNSTF